MTSIAAVGSVQIMVLQMMYDDDRGPHALLLAAGAARHMTGASLVVDGGRLVSPL